MTDGSLPAGEVKTRFRTTLPLDEAVPEDRAKESGPACPKEARADSRDTTANIHTPFPGVEYLLILVPSVL
jgi:hypothetical protein